MAVAAALLVGGAATFYVARDATPAHRASPAGSTPARPSPTARSRRDGAPPPNVVVIVTDDQRTGLAQMRHTTRLFKKQGLRLAPGFATTPLCCPSRASIMSGRYMHNHNVANNRQSRRLDQEHTIQSYLDDAGYQTGAFGKLFNSWSIHDAPSYFDRWAFFSGQSGYYGKTWNTDGRVGTRRGYSTRIIMREALAFLEESERSDSDPFFAYIAPSAPHGPALPERRYEDARVVARHPDPAALERDRSDKPPYVREGHAVSAGGHSHETRTLFSVDELVGRVFERLDALGERNTLAFFLSDNGVLWGEHGLAGKAVPYTPSVEVPLFMRWPGRIPGGRTDGRLGANIDIAPTVLQAAGIEQDSETPMDGRSLLRTWQRRWLLLEYKEYKVFLSPSWASLRSRGGQYVEYYEEGKTTFHEFYDLRKDPHQLENLLRNGDPTDNPNVRRLHRKLARARSCSGSSCP